MERLTDKVVLVAGGGGISTGVVTRLAAEGARVVVGDIRLAAAESIADQVESAGGRAVAAELDIADAGSIDQFVQRGVTEFGRIDALFNVAAAFGPDVIMKDTDLLDTPVEVWRRTIDTNLTGYFLTCRAVLPELLKNGGGSIVNTASDSAYGAETVRVAYSSSKAGVTALSRHIAVRWGKEGIRCNAILPGVVVHGAIAEMTPDQNLYDIWKGIGATQLGLPSPRFGTPADIGGLVAFLVSSDSEYINGQSIGIDGGLLPRA